MIFVILFSCLSRGPDDQGLSCGPGSPSIGKACRTGPHSGSRQREKKGQGIASALRLPAAGGEGGYVWCDERTLPLVTRTVDVSGERARVLARLESDAAWSDGPPRPACPRATLRRRPGAAGCPPSRSSSAWSKGLPR